MWGKSQPLQVRFGCHLLCFTFEWNLTISEAFGSSLTIALEPLWCSKFPTKQFCRDSAAARRVRPRPAVVAGYCRAEADGPVRSSRPFPSLGSERPLVAESVCERWFECKDGRTFLTVGGCL